jgi:predicted HicB family RNase H-like nuclease
MEKRTVNLNVRMPSDLHERVKRRAERDMRSLNFEVLWLLAHALDTLESHDEPDRQQTDAS